MYPLFFLLGLLPEAPLFRLLKLLGRSSTLVVENSCDDVRLELAARDLVDEEFVDFYELRAISDAQRVGELKRLPRHRREDLTLEGSSKCIRKVEQNPEEGYEVAWAPDPSACEHEGKQVSICSNIRLR
jgi:hypothetical protein